MRNTRRNTCVKCEANHPRRIKRDALDRKEERDMCKRLEHNFKQLLDPILKQYEQ